MLSFNRYLTTLVLTGASPVLSAFTIGGPACSGVGTACSFTYQDTSGTVTVNAFCAPNGYCGDNGASCTSNDNCYDYCGTDGICGGIGATCTTTETFTHNQYAYACYTPGYACALRGGVCVVAASPGARRRRDLKREIEARQKIEKSCDEEKGEQVCLLNGQFECLDPLKNVKSCGGCLKSSNDIFEDKKKRGFKGQRDQVGVDCSKLEGVDGVDCLGGKCIVHSCLAGFVLVDDSTCVWIQ